MNPSKSIWKFYKLIATDIAVINGRDPVVVSDREIGDNPRAENDLEAENDREVGNDHQDRDSHKMAFFRSESVQTRTCDLVFQHNLEIILKSVLEFVNPSESV